MAFKLGINMNREKSLRVYINDKFEGILSNDENGKFTFQYDKSAKMALSLSLPKREEIFLNEYCNGFFNGLLPEAEETRRMLGQKYSINPNNDFAILQAIGYDCPGAVSFLGENDENNLAEYYEKEVEQYY